MPEQSQDGGAEEVDTADEGSEDASVAATPVDPVEAPVVPTEAQAKAVESFLATANSVAQRIQALWISFISFGAFLTITVLETTHLKLFLSDAVKLPVFNIDLPLTNFYLIAPAFFLIFHFYLLTQLILLTRTADAFETVLAALPPGNRDAVRMRLDNSIFLQMIAGAEAERTGGNAWFIRLSAWLTVIWLPLSLLLLIQLQFLPYHHEWLTTFHRCALSIDLFMLWMLWPTFRRGRGLWSVGLYIDRSRMSVARACLGLGLRTLPGLVLLAGTWLIIVYPGEPLYSNWVTRLPAAVISGFGEKSAVSKWILAWRVEPERGNGTRLRKPIETFSLTEIFLEPRVDYVVGVPRGFFSNTIVLPDKKFADDKIVRELDEAEKDLKPGEFKVLSSLSFRGRNLAQAVLPRTDLRRSDFTGAILDGANFEGAALQRSRFGCADRGPRGTPEDKPKAAAVDFGDDDDSDSNLDCARLNQARLYGAHLQLSDLSGAELQKATFFQAELDGAVLDRVKAQGASFGFARMIGVSFASAKLQGVTASRTRFYNTNFEDAELQGANLSGAIAHGAKFYGSNLQGANLANAGLNAASFSRADLQGASLRSARLQGAGFDEANLRLASLEQAELWRVTGTPKSVEHVNWDRAKFTDVPYDNGKFEIWQNKIADNVSNAALRKELLESLSGLDPRNKPERSWVDNKNGPTASTAKVQVPRAPSSATSEEEQRTRKIELTKFLGDLACGAENAPFVARRLILNRRLAEVGSGMKDIAKRIQSGDPEACPGSVGLTGIELSSLLDQVNDLSAK
jgi:uncharacterized protein YjbI with pentapeptide repeats